MTTTLLASALEGAKAAAVLCLLHWPVGTIATGFVMITLIDLAQQLVYESRND